MHCFYLCTDEATSASLARARGFGIQGVPKVGNSLFSRSEQDEFISSIEGPDLQQQLRWLRYLERLNAGAWEIT